MRLLALGGVGERPWDSDMDLRVRIWQSLEGLHVILSLYVYIYAYICVFVCVCVLLDVCVCIHICIYIYIHTRTHIYITYSRMGAFWTVGSER